MAKTPSTKKQSSNKSFNSNRVDTVRKYVVFNFEVPGNHILLRQVNQR